MAETMVEWWKEGLSHKDWLFDGQPIHGDVMLERWHGLDWSKAWMDMGPSPMGNPGPYWHVPLPSEETAHRLYPKLLQSKWLWVVRQVAVAAAARVTSDASDKG
jgi:hypothetical protein